ncbi:MAG: helix-turn-helix domain-containing protein [Rhizobiaceae bacterium]
MYVTSPLRVSDSEIAYPVSLPRKLDNSNVQEIKLGVGENLFFEGDNARYIYEVIEGVVRSSKVLMDGRRQVLNFCYPGELVGVSHDKHYHYDCDAVSPVKIRVYRKNASMDEILDDPEFCMKLLRNTAAEVNSMQEHFMMLGRKSAMEKTASFLVAVVDRQKFYNDCGLYIELPMSRADIADFLGVTIETVSRNLTKLRKFGVINLPRTCTVQICKPAELRRLAENEI